MAVAIMGGLIVATVLTLLALPAMYAAAPHQKGHGLSLFCAKERRFCG
jgi:Cu/Ag efflux pump CusA